MLPLRDLFASLFFVSVGMLIDPRVCVTRPGDGVLSAVVMIGKVGIVTRW